MTTRTARKTDPETSKTPGIGEGALRASQARVLAMFKLYGDLTDQQLLMYLHDAEKAAGLRLMSPSGARSRRSELAQPNTARMRELRRDWYREHNVVVMGESIGRARLHDDFGALEEAVPVAQRTAADEWARRTLRIEGFRSLLWDTGRRVKSESGYPMIVWGIAR